MLLERRHQSWSGLNQDDAGRRRIKAPEVPTKRLARDGDHDAGQLHAGRASANDDDGQVFHSLGFARCHLGALEGGKKAITNFQGILDGLQPWRARLPFVVPEVGVARSGGEDQVVVREFTPVAQQKGSPLLVDGGHVCREHGRVTDRP
jgi:hypothetical protein